MQYRDQYSQQAIRTTIPPQSVPSNAGAKVGASVDMAGMKSCLFLISTGVFTAGTESLTPKLQESDNNTTWTDVPAAYVQSDAPNVLAASFSYRLGYIGGKRYVRPAVVVGAVGTAAMLAAVAVVEPLVRPVP